jgi:tetratricopeptide (TPR) repeat protein
MDSEVSVGIGPEIDAPKSADELVDIGTAFYMQRRPDVARLYFDAALLKDPDHGRALHNISSALIQGHLLDAALSTARRALNRGLDDNGIMMNITAALNGLGRFEEVLAGTNEIIRNMPPTDPRLPAVLHNRGLVFNHLERLNDAIASYDKALVLTDVEEQRNLILSDRALALLGMGRIKDGCRAYEVRWDNRLHKCKVWELGIPQWQGENLSGKKIILQHEQGFGDGIMLGRLAPAIRATGAEVILAVPNQLIELFKNHTLWSPTQVFDWENDFEELLALKADYHVPMLTALGLLGFEPQNISPEPYLRADPEYSNLGPGGFRIGICWASGYHSFALNIRRRYVPLNLLFSLAEIPKVRLVSLQKDEPSKDILNLGAESFIHDSMAKCVDFADTAKVVAGLDLVISVDSAIVHLAGALGIPTIMLGPYVRCWRWWGGRTGWPWYKNFKIFPQESFTSWDGTMERVVREVSAIV